MEISIFLIPESDIEIHLTSKNKTENVYLSLKTSIKI